MKDPERTKVAIMKQMQSQYKNHRNKLHNIFKSYNSKEEALNHVPRGLCRDDWTFLCDLFKSEKFQERSARNTINRKANKTPTTNGTKSLARVAYEMGKDISAIDKYEMGHTSKKLGGLVNDLAKEKLGKMKELQSTTAMTPEEICLQEVERVPGHARERCVGKKESAVAARYRSENEELKRKAEEAESKSAELGEKLKATEVEISNMKQMHAGTNKLVQMMYANLSHLLPSRNQ